MARTAPIAITHINTLDQTIIVDEQAIKAAAATGGDLTLALGDDYLEKLYYSMLKRRHER
jgi:hypothetical protein